MASTVTNSIPLQSISANVNMNPTLLLSPLNLPLASDWQTPTPDSHDSSPCTTYIPSYLSSTQKLERVSLAGKLKKVFKKKDRPSKSVDRMQAVPVGESHGYPGKYVPLKSEGVNNRYSQSRIGGEATNLSLSPHQSRSLQSESMNQPADELLECRDDKGFGRKPMNVQPQANSSGITPTRAGSNQPELPKTSPDCIKNPNFDRKVSNLSISTKNKFKSSLQLFASTFKKTKYYPRDRYLSEYVGNETNEVDSGGSQNIKYFHYNTVSADDYKEIFKKHSGMTNKELLDSSCLVYTPPIIEGRMSGSATGNPFGQKVTSAPNAMHKKNRFTVSTAAKDLKIDKPAFQKSQWLGSNLDVNQSIGKTTIMGKLLKRQGMEQGCTASYNTVGPEDNRDRRPSVSLHDFLEMYKEKTLNAPDISRKFRTERKRSISQSDCECCSGLGMFKDADVNKPQALAQPSILISSEKEYVDKNDESTRAVDSASDSCTCLNQNEIDQNLKVTTEATVDERPQLSVKDSLLVETVQQHSIPEHQEVHHESPAAAVTNFMTAGKTVRKNRFTNRRAVAVSEGLRRTNCTVHNNRRTSSDASFNFDSQKGSLRPTYDHSLTVSGYPRRANRLTVKKSSCRRLSEPSSNQQKWPDLKTNQNMPSEDNIAQYRKVCAISLGIDIPTDEFHNKLLVWIDNRTGTKILPLPQEDHDVWGGNRDENSTICDLAKRYKCYNVMPTSGKLVLFDSELPVSAAFEAFTFNRVRSAPIWDSQNKQLTGMFTVSDFIHVLLICVDHPELFENITNQTISDWKALSTKAKLEGSKESYWNVENGVNDQLKLDVCLSKKDEPPSSSRPDILSSVVAQEDGSASARSGHLSDAEVNNIQLVSKLFVDAGNDLHNGPIIDQTKPTLTTDVLEQNVTNLSPETTESVQTNLGNTVQTIPDFFVDANDDLDFSNSLFSSNLSDADNTSDAALLGIMGPAATKTKSLDADTGSVMFDAGLISVESDDTLYDAICALRTFSFHRTLVMDYKDNDPLYILTYKRILYFIYVMMDTINIPPFMNSSIRALNVGTFTNLVTITYDTTLREALTLLQWRSVSAIPVLDERGRVVDLYTKEDVMNLVYNNMFTKLNSTIREILDNKRRIFEGLFKCKETDSLMAVVQYFISSKAHRLVVTDDENCLLGIISISDAVNFMVFGCQSDVDGEGDVQ